MYVFPCSACNYKAIEVEDPHVALKLLELHTNVCKESENLDDTVTEENLENPMMIARIGDNVSVPPLNLQVEDDDEVTFNPRPIENIMGGVVGGDGQAVGQIDDAEEAQEADAVNARDWFKKFQNDFEIIVSTCSSKVIQAFRNNDPVQDETMRRRIRNEFISTVTENLRPVFKMSVPKIEPARKIAEEMTFRYPAMFRTDELDPKTVAKIIQARYRDYLVSERKKEKQLGVEFEQKSGKRKKHVGVDQGKWHNKKARQDALADLKNTTGEMTFEEREDIFQSSRVEIAKLVSNSNKNVADACPGILKDPRHVGGQFKFMTDCEPRDAEVSKNLADQLGRFEEYLTAYGKEETKAKLVESKEKCEVEDQGDQTFYQLTVLRCLGSELDKDGSSLFAFEGEDGSAQPQILCRKKDQSWEFDIVAEKKKILIGIQGLGTAIASFIHVAYVFNLMYPKDAQTVADLLQRKVCNFGDQEGTRTWKAVKAAGKAIDQYFYKIGRLM